MMLSAMLAMAGTPALADGRAVAGAGSCIFLHIWSAPAASTVGCTALALSSLRALVAWLDDETRLVQLPRVVYAQLQRAWDLPPLGQRK